MKKKEKKNWYLHCKLGTATVIMSEETLKDFLQHEIQARSPDKGLLLGWSKGLPPGVGNGNPLQYSCLENPMDRGGWQATVHDVTKSRTGLSDWTSTCKGLPTWEVLDVN